MAFSVSLFVRYLSLLGKGGRGVVGSLSLESMFLIRYFETSEMIFIYFILIYIYIYIMKWCLLCTDDAPTRDLES